MTRPIAVHGFLLAIAGLVAIPVLPASANALDVMPQMGAMNGGSFSSTLIAQEADDDDDNEDDDEDIELSESVRTAIIQRVAAASGQSASQLQIVAARREEWTDGCLGLGGIAQSCLQAIVPGYLVVVMNGEQASVYRTDEAGTVVVLDEEATSRVVVRRQTMTQQQTTQTTQTQTGAVGVSGSAQQTAVSGSFSQTVRTAVFQAIVQRTQIQTSQLQLVEVRRKVWATSCLGLNMSDRTCGQAITPGYLVVARSSNQVFVYRTDLTGSVVLLDETASRLRTAQLRTATTNVSFRDVSANYWAASFIRQLAALNIIDGYPDGSYRPDRPVTRAEFAAIIRRAFDEIEVREAVNFLDVERNYWAYSAIQETYQMGFLSGTANSLFRPVASLTRGDVLFALATGLQLSTTTSADTLLSVFNQTNLRAEERTLLAALTEQGIIVNYPEVRSLNLERTVTRAEVAVIVYQTLASLGRVETIESPYIVRPGDIVEIDDDDEEETGGAVEVDGDDDDDNDDDGDDDDGDDDDGDDARSQRQNCNQGIGNGAEGCDPGNSQPRGGSNDEGGRTPGARP